LKLIREDPTSITYESQGFKAGYQFTLKKIPGLQFPKSTIDPIVENKPLELVPIH
jgi:hypothetical protein